MHVPLSYPVLVPGIHAFPGVAGKQDVDGRTSGAKTRCLPGHDGN